MRAFIQIVVFSLLVGCTSLNDQLYRTEGAGLALNTELTRKNTVNLDEYFKELCLQAGYSVASCVPITGGGKQASTWKILVETGYNDIDYRCNSYLNWIDAKRTEKLFVDRSAIALGTLVGGTLAVANAGQNALSYVALALGFATTVYDAYHDNRLLGLEGSTIKEIVNQRRLLHRENFKDREYANRPDAILALRSYLTYCTPQSILTDVNIFSRDAVAGRSGLAERSSQRVASLVPSSNSAAGPSGRRNFDALPRVPEIFEGPGFGPEQTKELQAASCISVDGKVGKQTEFAVYILQETILKADADGGQLKYSFDKNNKISGIEWPLVDKTRCSPPFKNYFEKVTFGPNGSSDFGKNIVLQLANDKHIDENLTGKTLVDDDVRAAISALRTRINLEESTSIGKKIGDHITLELLNKLYPDTYKKPVS